MVLWAASVALIEAIKMILPGREGLEKESRESDPLSQNKLRQSRCSDRLFITPKNQMKTKIIEIPIL